MSQSSHTAFITGASSGIGAIHAERLPPAATIRSSPPVVKTAARSPGTAGTLRHPGPASSGADLSEEQH